jgi:hypothetical protein
MNYNEWRARLPYGKWTCADGREVLFNRSHMPILERRPGEPAKLARPGEWVESIVDEEFFFDDYTDPKRHADTLISVNAVLVEWGLAPLPPMPPSAEVIPFPKKISATPARHRDPATIPPLVNPWEYPFGSMPKPKPEPEPEEPEKEVPAAEEPRKPPPLLSLDDAKTIWDALWHWKGSHEPGLYSIYCPLCGYPNELGVVVKDATGDIAADGTEKYIDVRCDGCDVRGLAFFKTPADPNALLMTSAQFASFTPPDYMIDGLVQRRFLYALTGPTGSGKTAIALRIALHVSKGWKLGDREVEQGAVLRRREPRRRAHALDQIVRGSGGRPVQRERDLAGGQPQAVGRRIAQADHGGGGGARPVRPDHRRHVRGVLRGRRRE